jgi:S-adenosyl methyltransferase
VLLMQVLGHIGDPRDGDQTALAVVGQIKDALPPGGCLVISEIADTDPTLNAALRGYRQTGAVPYHARRPEQIARFFDGLEPAHPGVVPIWQWRPDPSPFTAPAVPAWGGAGAKT